jgi:hypothetical protein
MEAALKRVASIVLKKIHPVFSFSLNNDYFCGLIRYKKLWKQ